MKAAWRMTTLPMPWSDCDCDKLHGSMRRRQRPACWSPAATMPATRRAQTRPAVRDQARQRRRLLLCLRPACAPIPPRMRPRRSSPQSPRAKHGDGALHQSGLLLTVMGQIIHEYALLGEVGVLQNLPSSGPLEGGRGGEACCYVAVAVWITKDPPPHLVRRIAEHAVHHLALLCTDSCNKLCKRLRRPDGESVLVVGRGRSEFRRRGEAHRYCKDPPGSRGAE